MFYCSFWDSILLCGSTPRCGFRGDGPLKNLHEIAESDSFKVCSHQHRRSRFGHLTLCVPQKLESSNPNPTQVSLATK